MLLLRELESKMSAMEKEQLAKYVAWYLFINKL